MRKLTVLVIVAVLALSVSALALASGHRSGAQLWETVCIGCHDTGMMDAPLAGSAEFKNRLDKKGLDKLVENAMNGLDEMPPKGSCNDCSEAEIRAAIKYMLKI